MLQLICQILCPLKQPKGSHGLKAINITQYNVSLTFQSFQCSQTRCQILGLTGNKICDLLKIFHQKLKKQHLQQLVFTGPFLICSIMVYVIHNSFAWSRLLRTIKRYWMILCFAFRETYLVANQMLGSSRKF